MLKTVYDRTGRRDGYVSLEVSPYLGPRHGRNGGRGAAALGQRRAGQPPDQGAGHAGGGSGHRAVDRGGHQCQRDPAVRPGKPTSRWLRPTCAVWRKRPRTDGTWPHRQRGELLHLSDRHAGGRLPSRPGWRPADEAGKGRLRGLLGKVAIANAKLTYKRYQEIMRERGLAGAGRPGRPAPAAAVGQHQRQGPELQRRAVRRGARRRGYGEHHAAGDSGWVPRSREGPKTAWKKTSKAHPRTMAALEQAGLSMQEVTDKLLEGRGFGSLPRPSTNSWRPSRGSAGRPPARCPMSNARQPA